MLRLLKPSRFPSLVQLCRYRKYHSTDFPNVIVNPNLIESRILTKATEYIPKYGFDSRAVTRAVRELGYPDSLISVLTATSNHSLPFQLVMHWLKLKRQELEDFAQMEMDPQLSESAKLKALIETRLSYNVPIMDQLSQGLSYLVVPYHVPASLEELLALGDDMAYHAGDQSNDFAWYSKRGAICGIYLKSELFMLGDTSHDYRVTKEFVRSKVGEMESAGRAWNDTEEWLGFNAISFVNLIKSQLARG
ncbi:uncharacterized protein LODBEIA_P19630 [Lodderomyces beijingensis]|uniref:Ubiquinone biosynthesis protein n=1 Tax=Lodderomyces beijingensis TaxID=1775926 RepID=A0ABP0ZHW0_9ASCO